MNNSIDSKDIGRRIANLRKEHGVTQQDLAYKLQITIACLSRYENGIRKPKLDIIEKIALLFSTDLNYFMDYSNSNCKKVESTNSTKEKMIFDLTLILNNANENIIIDVKKYAELLIFKEEMQKKEV
jgi:transcriptional regulator with XRE-family HTH domain